MNEPLYERSVMITGGTGFFGRAFAIEARRQDAARICIFSRGEAAQATMRSNVGNDDRYRWFIGDVRDRERLERAMERIDIVVHAAALKRIEVGHYNPDEMIKTNVHGAMNVIEAARCAGVGHVVLLSSDKAYQPVSAYGLTKALAECLFSAANSPTIPGPRHTVVRYGNVAGSTGSVIPRWRAAIAEGKQIVVNDMIATRFWMTIQGAVDVVLTALKDKNGGLLFIPLELAAYRLGDLAHAMGANDIVSKGMPPWEKLHETLTPGISSDMARRMSVEELKQALVTIP